MNVLAILSSFPFAFSLYFLSRSRRAFSTDSLNRLSLSSRQHLHFDDEAFEDSECDHLLKSHLHSGAMVKA